MCVTSMFEETFPDAVFPRSLSLKGDQQPGSNLFIFLKLAASGRGSFKKSMNKCDSQAMSLSDECEVLPFNSTASSTHAISYQATNI